MILWIGMLDAVGDHTCEQSNTHQEEISLSRIQEGRPRTEGLLRWASSSNNAAMESRGYDAVGSRRDAVLKG